MMDLNTGAVGSSYREIQETPGQSGRGGNPTQNLPLSHHAPHFVLMDINPRNIINYHGHIYGRWL